jgi:hypothetical protein
MGFRCWGAAVRLGSIKVTNAVDKVLCEELPELWRAFRPTGLDEQPCEPLVPTLGVGTRGFTL